MSEKNHKLYEENKISFNDKNIIIEDITGGISIFSKKYYSYYVPSNLELLKGHVEELHITHLSNSVVVQKFRNVFVANNR